MVKLSAAYAADSTNQPINHSTNGQAKCRLCSRFNQSTIQHIIKLSASNISLAIPGDLFAFNRSKHKKRMSRNRTRLGFLLAALMLLFISVKPAAAQDEYGGDIDYQQFYDELSPYGQWVSDPDYGYVWIPDAGDDFRPYYSNGYWAYTDYGNTWVSNYNWGWAPFHYGRWTYNNFYGWMWIPGNTWGPAWVSWRGGGANYGWAPLGPGISINIAIGGYNCPDYWWNFMPQQHIFARNWNRYSYGPRYNNTYINQTTIINNTYIVNRNTYLGGPRRDDLRRATGRDVRPLAINNSREPQRARVRGNNLNIYRPAVAAAASGRSAATIRPREFRQAERPIQGNTPASAAGFGTRPERGNRNPAVNPGNERPGSTPIRGRNNPAAAPDRQPVQQPLENNGFDRRRDRRGSVTDRNANQPPVQTAPDRGNWNAAPQQAQPQANPRRFEQTRPQQQPRSFEQPRQQQRFEQAPQPQAQPQPRFERSPRVIDRPQPVQQQRFEQPRQQAAPQPQRSFEQPRQQPQPQRMEQPRAMPQQQAPSVSPREGRFGR